MNSESKIVHLWGLTWPTLIVGAVVVLGVALTYAWIVHQAVNAQ